jgi:hypothetical protein
MIRLSVRRATGSRPDLVYAVGLAHRPRLEPVRPGAGMPARHPGLPSDKSTTGGSQGIAEWKAASGVTLIRSLRQGWKS